MALSIVFYVWLKSYIKVSDRPINKTIKFIIAQIIAVAVVTLISKEPVASLPLLLLQIIISAAFVYIFKNALKPFYDIPKNEEITQVELICGSILVLISLAFLAKYTFFGMH